jgi:hypothetical protein
MTNTTTIALNKLLAWQGNVRKTDPDKAIDELAASIAAHGLLQSLVVRKDKRGKYAVVAGQRRLLALKSLRNPKSSTRTGPSPAPSSLRAPMPRKSAWPRMCSASRCIQPMSSTPSRS